ncbi:helix-turn-helix transcriptional regulator [Phytohabitans houttuyneae]|uniref:HTH cro/C1-type domain-containing protein n=1 Tax=Phytohabitans houttuyneae TaxID=1076126 RepID=A0A6V8KJW7_9ACTN|nr:helix-turn-helix transcriptional regulator [Phytohabitans houttuyneae]GFJ82037.1 hypothetical protein Phou_062170 [Phytohabitans houttuyneae]
MTRATAADGQPMPHELTCASSIRVRELLAAGDPTEPDPTLLHHIAHTIHEHCGHPPLKAHRLAWGWTPKQATTALDALSNQHQLPKRGITQRSWHQWEAGTYRPDDDYLDRIARLFHTNIIKLGYATDHTAVPAASSRLHSRLALARRAQNSWLPDPSGDPGPVDSAGEDGLSLMDRLVRLRHGVGSLVGEGAMTAVALDDWEQAVVTHGQATRYQPPARLLADLSVDFGELQERIARPHTLSTLRRLTVVAAQMAGLVSLTLLELNENAEARHWARVARNAADEAGDPATRTWVRAQQAYADYYSGNLHAALHAAQAAQAVAGRKICVGSVLAATLEARAHAALGRHTDACDTLQRAQLALEHLDPDADTPSAFSYNEAQLRFHEGNAYTHLRDTASAWAAQQRALELYPDSDYLDRSLVRFDRATCLVHDGDIASAMSIAVDLLLGLAHEQRSEMIVARGHRLLAQLTPRQRQIEPARDLRELLMTAHPQGKVKP